MSVNPIALVREEVGIAFTARTGRRHKAHGHPGCLKQESCEEAWRRALDFVEAGVTARGHYAIEEVGTYCLVAYSLVNRTDVEAEGGEGWNDVRRVAQIVTALLSSTCRQWSVVGAVDAALPMNGANKLGQAGLSEPEPAAAVARKAGRYRLRAAQER